MHNIRAFSRVFGSIMLVSGASLGAQTGTLTVYKTFEPTSLGATMGAPASFPVQIACSPGTTTTVSLSSANQFQSQTSAMPAGTVCTIIELTPQNATLRPGCRWSPVVYPKEQRVTIPNGTASLVVQNGISCEDKPPVAGNVRLNKIGGGAVTVGAGVTFYLRPANVGPGSVVANGATVVDTLPAMFSSVTAVGAPDWNCSVSGLIVTCTYTGSVGPGQSMAQIIVTARAEREGERGNCATIALTPGPDAQPGDNRSCVDVTVRDVVAPTPSQSLTVKKVLVPVGDIGKFVLRIDNINRAFGVGNNGTTGAISLTAGTHTVSELAYPGTSLSNYTTTFGGDCTASGNVMLAPGTNKTCTITNTRKHSPGSWTLGPGTAVVTVCAAPATCTITGYAGQVIPVTIEVWGAGGGGGGGSRSVYQNSGGQGGGGGGGGGYGKTTITLTVPSSGSIAYTVIVGSGGAGGLGGFPIPAQTHGKLGGFSEVRVGTSSGALVVKATGGGGGVYNNIHGNQLLGNGAGGAGGTGTVNSWAGLVGGATATSLSTCNGGAGAPGGVGGGPGAINNGGNGGHGGYLRSIAAPTCTAQSSNNSMTPGAAGANGRVTLTW